MRAEKTPNEDDNETTQQDPFIDEGLSSGGSDCEADVPNTPYAQTTRRLRKAKAKWERLKQQLFRALDEDVE